MDISEFKKKNIPGKKRSKLEPYIAEIIDLQNSDFTLKQICEFLKLKGVTVTIPTLHNWIKRRTGTDKTEPIVTLITQQTTADSRNKDIDLINKTSVPGFGKTKPTAPTN